LSTLKGHQVTVISSSCV